MKRIITVLTLSVSLAFSGSAFRGMQTYTNADSSTFQGQLQGDPWFHYILEDSGNIVVFNNNEGNYKYADYDNTGAHPKLKPSSIKAGTLSASRLGNPTPAQLQSAWSAARASVAASALSGILAGKIWYEVRDYGNGLKTLHMVSGNMPLTKLTYQKIENGQLGVKKDNLLHISGQKLINDSVGHLYYSVFTPQGGYMEVKVYEAQTAGTPAVLAYTDRWFPDQNAATTYFNSL